MAEGVGFEPTETQNASTVFETGPFVRSGTLPLATLPSTTLHPDIVCGLNQSAQVPNRSQGDHDPADVPPMTTSDPLGAPRAAWDVIEQTCTSRFTGELALKTASATTNVYMTRGLIYLAEYPGEPTLIDRLLAAGVISPDLLPPDSPNTANLDAVFSVDPMNMREHVEAVIQLDTEKVLLEIAAETVLSFQTTMYRHHPSKVDRWFSSQHARSQAVADGCATDAGLVDTTRQVEPTPAPDHLIPPLRTDESATFVPDDVADAVRRAVDAIETATQTLGQVPKGFVRAPRPDKS